MESNDSVPEPNPNVRKFLEGLRAAKLTRKKDFHGTLRLLEALPTDAHLEAIERRLADCGGDIDMGFLGFIDDYVSYAEIIGGHSPEDTVVVDVGCAYGFQHVLFQHCLTYIGIDGNADSITEALTPNAQFWQGDFGTPEIQERLDLAFAQQGVALRAKVEAQMQEGPHIRKFIIGQRRLRTAGIANMSINYTGSDRKDRARAEMIRCFDTVFIL